MQPLWYTESQTDPQQGAWSVYLRMKPTGCPRQNTHFTCRMWSHHCAVSAVVVLIVAVLSWQEINETFSVWLKRDRGELFFSLSSWIAKYLGAALYVKFRKKEKTSLQKILKWRIYSFFLHNFNSRRLLFNTWSLTLKDSKPYRLLPPHTYILFPSVSEDQG